MSVNRTNEELARELREKAIEMIRSGKGFVLVAPQQDEGPLKHPVCFGDTTGDVPSQLLTLGVAAAVLEKVVDQAVNTIASAEGTPVERVGAAFYKAVEWASEALGGSTFGRAQRINREEQP